MNRLYNLGERWTPKENLRILEEFPKTFVYRKTAQSLYIELGRNPGSIYLQIKKLLPKNIKLVQLRRNNPIHLQRYENFLRDYKQNNNLV